MNSIAPHVSGTEAHSKDYSGAHSHHQSHNSFARASHFALVLIPCTLGVGYSLLVCEKEGSLFYHLGIFGMFVLGLMSAVGFLAALERVEDLEKR